MTSLRASLLIVWLLLIGCQTSLPQSRVRVGDEGAVYLYLQPLGGGAERSRVDIEGISALHRDGGEHPLSVTLRELNARDVRRQRLLAAGPLPAGEYAGLLFRTRSASPDGDEGESAVVAPEPSFRIDFRFTVRRREASVISLVLRNAKAGEAGFRFGPASSLYVPDRPAVGLMGFVANTRSNDITVFDKKSLQVFAVIATGAGPSGMALDQRAGKLYVALSGEDSVEVVDALAGIVADRIGLIPGDEPVALTLTRGGRQLLTANRGSNTVSLVDTASRFELARIPVGQGPRSIAIDPAERRAFVFNASSNSISVIDLGSRGVTRSIPTGPAPVRGQFNRRGDRLYVIHETVPYVTVVSPLTLAITGRFPIRSGMDAIKVDPNTDLVYLGARRDPRVGVYEPFSFGTVDFLDMGAGIAHMATDGGENALYLASPDIDRLFVFHRIRKTMAGELDSGGGPSWVSVMGED